MRVKGRVMWRTVIAVVVVLVVVVAAIVITVAVRDDGAAPAAVPETAPPPAAPAPARPLTAAAVDAPTPTAAALRAVIDPLAADPSLGNLSGAVYAAGSATPLWEREAGDPRVPASVTKVLTAFTALRVLGPDARVSTRVVAGADAGTVVLVAGGDVTVSALPTGVAGLHPGAARIDDLVRQLRDRGTAVTSVVLDTSLFRGPDFAPGWHREDVGAGYIAPIQPLMLDGARSAPLVLEPPRSATPARDAAHRLARDLGLGPDAVSEGTAPADAEVLAEVRSAPLGQRLRQMLEDSDNVIAEAILRELAVAGGEEASFAGGERVVRRELAAAGIPTDGLTLRDGSGLSDEDRIPADLLARLLAHATGPDATRPEAELSALLPVAGGTGTLTGRYRTESRSGAGWVRAKTGTLASVNSLAGTVTTVDGQVLVFAFISNGSSAGTARPALDSLATALRGCGCR